MSNNYFEIKIINASHGTYGVIISDVTSTYKEHQDTKHKSLHLADRHSA